jgi:hypothetical protein
LVLRSSLIIKINGSIALFVQFEIFNGQPGAELTADSSDDKKYQQVHQAEQVGPKSING